MRSYETTRLYFGFFEFLAWCGVALGVIFALSAASAASRYSGFGAPSGALAAIPGIAIVMGNLSVIIFCQMGRAGVDTAEMTGQILKVARDQLDISKQALRQGSSIEQGFTALSREPAGSDLDEKPAVGFEQMAASPREDAPSPPELTQENANSTFTPIADEHGFTQLNEAGTEFEYCGRRLQLINGKYDLNGMGFANRAIAKRYINQLALPKS